MGMDPSYLKEGEATKNGWSSERSRVSAPFSVQSRHS
jgi:hypothetical protein